MIGESIERSRMLAIGASCVALDLAAGKVTNVLSLPVYLDTIGTILAAALLPRLLAVAIGIIAALLGWVVINPIYPFYAGTQAAIAIAAIIMIRLGFFRGPWRAGLMGMVIAVVSVLVSAPVTVMLFGGVTLPGTTAINAVLIAAGQNIWQAVVTGSLVVELVDKVVAVLMA